MSSLIVPPPPPQRVSASSPSSSSSSKSSSSATQFSSSSSSSPVFSSNSSADRMSYSEFSPPSYLPARDTRESTSPPISPPPSTRRQLKHFGNTSSVAFLADSNSPQALKWPFSPPAGHSAGSRIARPNSLHEISSHDKTFQQPTQDVTAVSAPPAAQALPAAQVSLPGQSGQPTTKPQKPVRNRNPKA
eukprot:CAMPEP_0175159338 /NCGR_PEP_ID=MMETSP0087-20121206/23351_1 /TAXON_ID=136419 /ORGANISM="Unknown Unknown, Strain D1" /LENGTH=188 /DNA_ID=CAMNT_0016447345 /DNA_START=145 /DNA_END=707 /DNA_ORIENTATION=+